MGSRLMNAIAAISLAILPAQAQESASALSDDWSALSRQATIDAVSDALTEINEPFAASSEGVQPAGWWGDRVDEAVTQVMDLRDVLAGNPFVRVSSFTVGFPWGVAVELTFPPSE